MTYTDLLDVCNPDPWVVTQGIKEFHIEAMTHAPTNEATGAKLGLS